MDKPSAIFKPGVNIKDIGKRRLTESDIARMNDRIKKEHERLEQYVKPLTWEELHRSMDI